jgi:hypothetical protein
MSELSGNKHFPNCSALSYSYVAISVIEKKNLRRKCTPPPSIREVGPWWLLSFSAPRFLNSWVFVTIVPSFRSTGCGKLTSFFKRKKKIKEISNFSSLSKTKN